MKNLMSTAIILVLATSCTYQVKPHKTWECHHSIPYVMEWRGNCVIYEAIVDAAQGIVDAGGRPWFVRMNNKTLNSLADEGKAERVRVRSGGALWLVETPWGSLRCVLDIRLNLGEIIVGRGWDVRRVGDESVQDGGVRAHEGAELEPSLHNPDNDVEF